MSEVWTFLKSLAGRPLVVGIVIVAVAAAFIAWRKSDQ